MQVETKKLFQVLSTEIQEFKPSSQELISQNELGNQSQTQDLPACQQREVNDNLNSF